MKENRSYNILHLTDLHIGPGGRSEVYTDRTGGLGEGEIKLAPEDAFDSFITRLQREITQGRVFKPDAILITGDLINKREIPRLKHSDKSSSADIEKQEKLIEKAIVDSFGHARMCIQKLQDALNVHDKKVMIVPGNHDVTWGRNKKFQDRFSEFTEATNGWVRPEIVKNQVNPTLNVLFDDRLGKKTEVHLFMSPTLSGVSDPSANKWLSNFKSILKEWSEDDLSDLLEKIDNSSYMPADIAALGTVQKEYIDKVRDDSEIIRIAAFHHHLLPDPGIDLGNYDSILDAGVILNSLVEKDFDLIISGHKHNRVLHKYTSRGKSLDIFSGASLFFQGNGPGAQPGFTIIRIFDDDNPYYAQLVHYNDALVQVDIDNLVRDGRVNEGVVSRIANVPMQRQHSFFSPLIDDLGDLSDWVGNDNQLWDVILEAWKPIKNTVERMKNRVIVFRPPFLSDQWAKLLKYIDEYVSCSKSPPALRLVSNGDLDYWVAAMGSSDSNQGQYEAAVRNYSNRKLRILILDDAELKRTDELKMVIKWMQDSGIEVRCIKSAVTKIQPPFDDFGLLSDKAVSKFQIEVEGANRTRYLEEYFGSTDIKSYTHEWNMLFDDSIAADDFVRSL